MGAQVKRDLPAYVYPKGRKGYLYFCRRGAKPIRMMCEPGTADFAVEYARLMKGNLAAPTRTVKKLIAHYLASHKWAKLALNTQKSYRRHFTYFEETMGSIDPATIRRVHVIEMRDSLADIPTDASRKVGALSVLMEYAINIDWIKKANGNPAHKVDKLKGNRPKREPWPADKIAKFRKAADPRTLLLFEMLIATGQRIGDVLMMQWDHIGPDGISVQQQKTDKRVSIPLTADLAKALADAPRIGPYIVSQNNGRKLGYNLAWRDFMSVRRKIGAEAWDIHCLRHTAASEIASLPGMTREHVMSITGHSSEAMARLYSGSAEQKARAKEAQNARGSKSEP
ncbi:MAG: tyrosine-type recombinase/integrase [Loktanella sp.]|nr:tyrosine-type recombinase/integrase [Loktanella sp.]